MTLRVPVFFDFACPYSYASRGRERRAEQELDVQFVYMPWQIHPEVPAEGEVDPEATLPDAAVEFAAANGAEVRGQPRRYRTDRLLAGVAVAQAHGRLGAYVDEAFRIYREGGENVHEERVLRKVADESGLDPEAFVAQVADGTWEPWLRACEAWAERLRVRSTLTYVLPGSQGPVAVPAMGSEEEFRALLAEHLDTGAPQPDAAVVGSA